MEAYTKRSQINANTKYGMMLTKLLFLCSELNDTVVEAELRIRQCPPPLPFDNAMKRYEQSTNRLLILVSLRIFHSPNPIRFRLTMQ